MQLLIMVLIVYGISAIITISKIFEHLRDVTEKHSPNFWKYLTSCMQCLPFWVGIFVSFVLGAPMEVTNVILPAWLNVSITYLFAGSLFSGTTMLIHAVYIRIQGKRWVMLQENETARKIKKGVIQEIPLKAKI